MTFFAVLTIRRTALAAGLSGLLAIMTLFLWAEPVAGQVTTCMGTPVDIVLSPPTPHHVVPFYGTSGQDVIMGSSAADTIYGGGGDDIICGGGGNDTVFGGDGHDRIEGNSGADNLHGDEGRDTLFGNDGDDRLYGGRKDDKLIGGDGTDRLWGEAGADELHGGANRDFMYGGNNSDLLWGGTGGDVMRGQDGDDVMFGQSGRDRMFTGAGSDRLWGGEGKDRLTAEGGSNQLFGGGNNDTALDMDFTTDSGDGGAGFDTGWGEYEGPVFDPSQNPPPSMPPADGDVVEAIDDLFEASACDGEWALKIVSSALADPNEPDNIGISQYHRASEGLLEVVFFAELVFLEDTTDEMNAIGFDCTGAADYWESVMSVIAGGELYSDAEPSPVIGSSYVHAQLYSLAKAVASESKTQSAMFSANVARSNILSWGDEISDEYLCSAIALCETNAELLGVKFDNLR